MVVVVRRNLSRHGEDEADLTTRLALPERATVAEVLDCIVAGGVRLPVDAPGQDMWVMYAGTSSAIGMMSDQWTHPRYLVPADAVLGELPGGRFEFADGAFACSILRHLREPDPDRYYADLSRIYAGTAGPRSTVTVLRERDALAGVEITFAAARPEERALAQRVGSALWAIGLSLTEGATAGVVSRSGGVGLYPYPADRSGRVRIAVRWVFSAAAQNPADAASAAVQQRMDAMLSDVLLALHYDVHPIWPGGPIGPVLVAALRP